MVNNNNYHVPVLSSEVISCLNLKIGEIAVDLTAGGGGHLELMAKAVGKTGKVIAIDQDIYAHQLNAAGGVVNKFSDRIKLFHASFSSLFDILISNNISKVNAILCDLGVSSFQLNIASRGFSFIHDGPIDMRMNKQSKITAYDILRNTSEKELANIIYKFGEEKFSKKIAKIIKINWPIANSTVKLSKLISLVVYNRRKKHSATRTFQALRIATNNECYELDFVLKNFANILTKHGRAVFISFHSLEDRKVKHAFRKLINPDVNKKINFRLINKKPIVPCFVEKKINIRSRSAKLRCIEKLY